MAANSTLDAMLLMLNGNSADLIAARSAQLWQAIAQQLVPLIGEQGFSVLFARCVYLTRSAYPWLADPNGPQSAQFVGLTTVLAGRAADEALAASQALLITFLRTLTVLIGAPLSNSILHHIGRDASPTEELSP